MIDEKSYKKFYFCLKLMIMSQFYSLVINKVVSLTHNAVEISFKLPLDLLDRFVFNPGQYITVKAFLDGDDIRRSYSICSSPEDANYISIGVKKIPGGKMSTFLTQDVKELDVLDVMPPMGSFVLEDQSSIVAICAGSGITPILSMIKKGTADVKLIYGNKSETETMFLEEIKKLNVDSCFAFSREEVNNAFFSRINNDVLREVIDANVIERTEGYFICGPGEMIDSVKDFLLDHGVLENKIYFERFFVSEETSKEVNIPSDNLVSNVTVIIDGDEFTYDLSSLGETILDSAMNQGADVPFSCKGAVCCTCKAKVIEGKVVMDANYSLSDQEVEEGYVLTCQSHPDSESVVVDFDEI